MTPAETSALEALLAEATSATEDDDAYWKAVSRVQELASPEMYKAVAALAESTDARVRALVPDVLRFLGGKPDELGVENPRPFREQTLALFARMLAVEREPRVIAAIGFANSDLTDERMAALMLPFRRHSVPTVRQAVVNGLSYGVGAEVRRAMIELTADPDPDVRNWATFTLASILQESDSPLDGDDVRDALAARADDPHSETHAEATLGLAQRKDPRAVPMILRGLQARPSEWDHYFEAAMLLPDPSFVEPLLELQSEGWPPEDLLPALKACGWTD